MAQTPLVTISIPAYNLGNYLEKTLQSIFKQTYQNFEVLLVDDASTDGTAEVIARLAEQDDRVKPHYFKTHEGVSQARNYAIDNAKGELIVFVDGDDLLDPRYLEIIVEGLQDPKTDLMIVGYNWGWRSSAGGDPSFEEITKRRAYDAINFGDSGIGGYTWNKGFRLSIIRENNLRFDETLALAEDLLFTAEYILVSHKFVFYNVPLYEKVNRRTSTIHNATMRMRSRERTVRQHIDDMGMTLMP